MNKKLKNNQGKEMNSKIHDVLINYWDPIGVKEFHDAQDEYDLYIPDILSLLIKKDKQQLFDYLLWLETEHMGLETADVLITEKVVDLLFEIAKGGKESLPEIKSDH